MNVARSQIRVHFVDVGQNETVPISNIRPLPENFLHRTALAIPFRLHGISPIDERWDEDHPIHQEFIRLVTGFVRCRIRHIEDRTFHHVDVEIPGFLLAKFTNLSTTTQDDESISPSQLVSFLIELHRSTNFFSHKFYFRIDNFQRCVPMKIIESVEMDSCFEESTDFQNICDFRWEVN